MTVGFSQIVLFVSHTGTPHPEGESGGRVGHELAVVACMG